MDQRPFNRAVAKQIAANLARTPTQRLEALFDLLDSALAMLPNDPESIERRRRAMVAKRAEREQTRASIKRLIASQRATTSRGV